MDRSRHTLTLNGHRSRQGAVDFSKAGTKYIHHAFNRKNTIGKFIIRSLFHWTLVSLVLVPSGTAVHLGVWVWSENGDRTRCFSDLETRRHYIWEKGLDSTIPQSSIDMITMILAHPRLFVASQAASETSASLHISMRARQRLRSGCSSTAATLAELATLTTAQP
jgi:hypothetical protein